MGGEEGGGEERGGEQPEEEREEENWALPLGHLPELDHARGW